MKIFAIKDVKKLFVTVIIILLGCIAAGQATVAIIANDYKEEMIAHDYAVAGYLLRNDLGKSSITAAFTGDKTAADLATGQALLMASGYEMTIV